MHGGSGLCTCLSLQLDLDSLASKVKFDRAPNGIPITWKLGNEGFRFAILGYAALN